MNITTTINFAFSRFSLWLPYLLRSVIGAAGAGLVAFTSLVLKEIFVDRLIFSVTELNLGWSTTVIHWMSGVSAIMITALLVVVLPLVGLLWLIGGRNCDRIGVSEGFNNAFFGGMMSVALLMGRTIPPLAYEIRLSVCLAVIMGGIVLWMLGNRKRFDYQVSGYRDETLSRRSMRSTTGA